MKASGPEESRLITVRPMTADDAPACHRIHAAATMSSYGRALSWLQPIVEDPATPLEPSDWTLVAEAGGQVVGYASVTGNHIENLFVSPGAQGLGIGGRLLSAVKGRITGAITLRCLLENPGARRFYERHGFNVVRVDRIVYHGRPLQAWFMQIEQIEQIEQIMPIEHAAPDARADEDAEEPARGSCGRSRGDHAGEAAAPLTQVSAPSSDASGASGTPSR